MSKYLEPSTEVFVAMAKSVDVESVPDDKKAALLVPVLLILRDSKYCRSTNLVLAALNYATVVFDKIRKTQNMQVAVTEDILIEIVMRLGALSDQPSLSAGDAEEMRTCSFEILANLLSGAPDGHLKQLYTARCLPALGHLVSLLINTAESTSSSPKLKVIALRCLQSVVAPGNANYSPGETTPFQPQLAIVCLTFMPGILATLTNLIKQSGDPRSGHSVTVESLAIFQLLVTTVLSDRVVAETEATNARDYFFAKCPQDGLQRLSSAGILPPLPLHNEYLNEVGRRISPVVATIFSSALFSTDDRVDSRIRMSAFQASVDVLNRSAKYLEMKDACAALVNCSVAALAEDSSSKLSEKLKEAMLNVPQLSELAEDSLVSILRSLPQFFTSSSLNFNINLSARLASLVGYARLLGSAGKLTDLFSSHECLMDLFRSCTKACQLKTLTQASLGLAPAPPTSQELSTAWLNDNSMWAVRYPRQELPFRYLDNSNCQQLFELFLETITTKVEDPSTIASFFFETMVQQLALNEQILDGQEGDDYRLESATFVLSVIISRLSNDQRQSSLLEIVALSCVERFCSEPGSFVKNRASLLLLSACAGVAAKASVESISLIIRRTLLAVLESCSSGKTFIENHAVHTLVDIARASGASSLSSFIETNADYLADAFVVRLRHLLISRQTLYAISAAFRFSSPSCLSYFGEALRDVIRYLSTSDYDPELAELLLLTTSHALSAILRWELPFASSNQQLPLLEEPDDETAGSTPNRVELPLHIVLARDAADAVAVLFASHHLNIKLAAIDVARIAILIVRPATNELLPLVYRLWSGLSARFIPMETRKQVIVKALDLLLAMAETSGDFIRHRFVVGMFPHVCSTIRHLVETMKKPGVRISVYRQTFDFKLLVRLARDLPRIASCVKITAQSDLDKVLDVLLFALATAIEVSPEADSLKKAAMDGLSIILSKKSNNDCNKFVRDYLSTQASSQKTVEVMSDLLLPFVRDDNDDDVVAAIVPK